MGCLLQLSKIHILMFFLFVTLTTLGTLIGWIIKLSV